MGVITHDLATAYYISDYIAGMYRGKIVEFGQARAILAAPQHPYTQLLVASIPSVDRSKRWEDEESSEPIAHARRVITGCKFAPRCRWATESCWQAMPPLYQTAAHRAAACVLYGEHPVLEGQAMEQVFQGRQ